MPAAAVIPAPIAYIKVVAVKKLVVGSRRRFVWSSLLRTERVFLLLPWGSGCFIVLGLCLVTITLNKLECLKQAYALNRLAWNNNRISLLICWFTGVKVRLIGSDGGISI